MYILQVLKNKSVNELKYGILDDVNDNLHFISHQQSCLVDLHYRTTRYTSAIANSLLIKNETLTDAGSKSDGPR